MAKKIFLTIAAMFMTAILFSQNLTVATYNIRNENNGDAQRGNGWNQRYPYICQIIRFEAPDFFGAQEVLKDQFEDMKAELPGYEAIGVGRDDGKEAGEYEPIFYRKDRFRLLDHGWFWIAEDPGKPALGWDAACIRICTWVRLKDRQTRRSILYLNLHMDHVGVVARREGAKLIVSKIRELKGKKDCVFVSGDFNVDQENEIYRIFTESGVLEDSFVTARDRYVPNGTFNSFNPNVFTTSRIDHIFVSPGTQVTNYAVLTETYRAELKLGGEQVEGRDMPKEVSLQRYIAKEPSDHFPVFIKVEL